MNFKNLLISTCCVAAIAAPLQAAITVSWGAQTVGAQILAADGSTLDTSNVTFQLGIFADDFVPVISNAADWRENFTIVGSDPGEAGEDVLQSLGVSQTEFPPGSGNIANTAGQNVTFGNANPGEVNTGDGTNLPEGAKLYIWAFVNGEDDFDPTSGQSPEWLLLSNDTNASNDRSLNTNEIDGDNWVVPSADIQTHNPTNLNLSTAFANEAVIGTNDEGDNLGDILRFQSIPIIVPEPSTALSALLGLGLLCLRRKRSD